MKLLLSCLCLFLSLAFPVQALAVSLTLINADSDLPIVTYDPLVTGVTLDLATLPTRNLNVRANTEPGFTGSVVFGLDGNPNFRTESTAPYALFGDSAGNYNAGTFTVASHTITATQSNGPSVSVTFNVVDSNPPPYFPPSEANGGWRRLVPRSATPTAQQKADVLATCGLNWDTLHQAKLRSDQLTTSTTILVIRHGWVCYEWGSTSNYLVHSVTKSFTGMAWGKLMEQTGITRDDFVHPYLPLAFGDSHPSKRLINFRQMFTMSSGIEPRDGQPATFPLVIFDDALTYPMSAQPGTEWAYTSLVPNLLSVSLQGITASSLRSYFNLQILNPIGVPAISSTNWATWFDYTNGAAGAKISARNVARLGYLLLHQGNWNGTQILNPQTVAAWTNWEPALEFATLFKIAGVGFATDPDSHFYYGGGLFWTNREGRSLGLSVPVDAFYMHGWNDNLVITIPSLDLIAVRLSGGGPGADPQFRRDFTNLIVGAVQ